MTGRMLAPRPNESSPQFVFFNGILHSSVKMDVLDRKVFRLDQNNQMQPSDGKISKGEYRWYVAPSGLYLEQKAAGYFIEFQSSPEGTPEHRYKVDLSVDEQKPEQLIISVGNQQIRITGEPSGAITSTPQKAEAPSAVVEGTALSKRLQTPLKVVAVKLVDHEGVNFQEKQRTTTENDGHFRFANVAAGQYVLGGPSMKDELDYLEFENSAGSMAEVSVGNRGTFSFGTVYLPDKRKP